MTWFFIGLIALVSLVLSWRVSILSKGVRQAERARITQDYRVEQLEKQLRWYVDDVYEKVVGERGPRVGWWRIEAPVVTHDGGQIHLMDIVGFGSGSEASEYAKVLERKHGGKFTPAEMKMEQYTAHRDEQTRLIHANGGRYVGARPFVHQASWLSDALHEECDDGGVDEEDMERWRHHPGHWWMNGRLIKGKDLLEQLRDLQREVAQLRIS